MVIFHSYVKLPQGTSPHCNFHVEKRWSGPLQIKPWYSYYPGPYWQDFYDDYDMINDIDLMKILPWNFRIGILVSHIYHIFIFYVPWHPNLAPMSVGLSLNQWPGDPGGPRRAARGARGKAWKMAPRGWTQYCARWWLEHEMRRNDEPTRYGLLMFIGDIIIYR